MSKRKSQIGEGNPFRAIIYTRVSTREQVEGTSLETQQESCIAYCEREGLEVDRIFVEEGESAKYDDRTQLQNVLEYCRQNKGKISHMVVYRLDRFFRNAKEHMLTRAELMAMGITLRSATEPIDDTIEGKLQEHIIAAINEYDNDVRAKRCVDGMRKKIEQGIWPLPVPIGYIPFKKLGAKEKKMIADAPHPEYFDIIKKSFDLYLTGQYSIAELARKLKSLYPKFKIYPQKMQYILSNKYYCGILTDPWDDSEHEGRHGAMISIQDYAKVQHIMKGKSKDFIPKKIINPDFPLKGTIFCGCGHFYTASWSKGRTKKYPYYHCHGKGCHEKTKIVKREILEGDFLDYLSGITPKKEYLEDFWKTVIKLAETKHKEVNAEYLKKEKELKSLVSYKDSLIEKNAKGILPDTDFQDTFSKLKLEIGLKEVTLDEIKCDIFQEQAVCDYARHFIYNLPRQWFDLGIEGKRRFQKLLFPSGLTYYGNKNFGTAKLCVIFEINQEFQKGKTNLVGPVGFEPTTKRL
jgi:site-specific DNA recombinase